MPSSQHGHLFQKVAPSSYNLNEETCIKFVREIIKALNFIHQRRVIHLDLKPQNIMMRSADREEYRVRMISSKVFLLILVFRSS